VIYKKNKRDLPKQRNTNDRAVSGSQIMLQQTRVAQGTPYFLSFVDAFPTVFGLLMPMKSRS
jgi:A/G-specific adenine glycosylase